MSQSQSVGSVSLKRKQSLPLSQHSISQPEPMQSKALLRQSSAYQSSVSLSPFPDFSSPSYKLTLQSILQLFSSLDAFTNNLQQKVDALLRAQENQFVQSYLLHMTKVRKQFQQMEDSINKLNQKIKYYENQGKMSQLVGKNHKLQEQSKDLYSIVAAKDRKIKDMELTMKVQKDEMKRLQTKIKTFLREKSENLLSKFQNKSDIGLEQSTRKDGSMAFFPTEIQKSQQRATISIKKDFSTHQNYGKTKDLSSKGKYCKSGTIHLSDQVSLINDTANVNDRLKKQLSHVKAKNKRLISFQSKVIQQKLQLQQFFIDTVQQIKKEIKIRKKMNQCTLQDFKKEDKLNLLIKILSNDEILGYLYERIFKKQETPLVKARPKVPPIQKSEKTLDSLLPKISFNLEFQKKV